MEIKAETPLVSVLIPAYNHEKYVQETIRAVIAQTYKRIEFILIDDGSTDATYKKALELEVECKARFESVKILSQENSGICATLNNLIQLANGDFVYIIASDDVPEADAISILQKCFNAPDVVLAVGDNSIIDSESNITSWGRERNIDDDEKIFDSWWEYNCYHRPELKTIGENFGSYESLVKGCYLTNGYLIKKEALIKTGGYKDGCLDDWYIQLQLAKLGRFRFVNQKLCRYRWHGTNTAKNNIKMRRLIQTTKETEEKKVRDSYDDELIRKFRANIDWSPEFFNSLDSALGEKNIESKKEMRLFYKKIRKPSLKQTFFFLASYLPFAFAFLRLYRKQKNGGRK